MCKLGRRYLLAVIGIGRELLGPLISAQDGVRLVLLLICSMTRGVGMLDQLVQEAWMNGVQHVEEPFTLMSLLASSPLVLHMELDCRIITHELTDLLSRELVEVGHDDLAHFCSLEDLLLASQHLLDEVLIEV